VPKAKKIPAAAFERIPALLDQGLSAMEIANALGCTVGTLRVKCSKMGISLRRKSRGETAPPYLPGTRAPSSVGAVVASRLTFALPAKTMKQLQQRATAQGLSISKLASKLIEIVARDGLYEAVLDEHEDVPARGSTISRRR
jgi:hypothetical protein